MQEEREEGKEKQERKKSSSWSEVAPNGVLPIPGVDALFLEPSLMISSSYASLSAAPHLYYSRSFFLSNCCGQAPSNTQGPQSGESLQNTINIEEKKEEEEKKKYKKRKRSAYSLNPKEQLAEQRHLEVRKLINDCHKTFRALPEVLSLLHSIEDRVFDYETEKGHQEKNEKLEGQNKFVCVDFLKLASVWQAPLYEITLSGTSLQRILEGQRSSEDDCVQKFQLFNQMILNEYDKEVLGTCLDTTFVLPRKSGFLISDITKIGQMIPGVGWNCYNIFLIDPPWENKSVQRRALYPTIPNRYLLSLPLRKLAHPEGALVGLWVTNREKLRSFVENELFPKWDIKNVVTWYWLKVKSNGEMVSTLDLAHHKPYECLLLGYLPAHTENLSQENSAVQNPAAKTPPDKQVLISIPGDHSRKPPVALLLSAYVPGSSAPKGLEIFARDMNPGWISWGNEPLHFQHLSYFQRAEASADMQTSNLP